MHILVLPSNYANPYNPHKTPFYRDHARLSADRGHATSVVALAGISVRDAVRARRWHFGLHRGADRGLTTWVYPYPAPPRSAHLDRWVRRRLTARLRRRYVAAFGAPDVIHAHGIPAAQCALWWHQDTGAPFAVTLHSTELYGADAATRVQQAAPALARAAARRAVSPGYARYLSDLTGYAFESAPNPVDTDFFRPAETERGADAPFVFACIADLNARKNQRLLLEAFARRFAGEPGYRLVLGGDGAARAALAQHAAALEVREQVHFTGQLDRAGVRDVLRSSDAFVLASRAETFGVVLVEALACGLPVVATRSHGPESIVRHDGLGILTEHSVGDLADAMATVANTRYDPDVLRAEAVERYAMARVGEAVERWHRHILEHAPRRR